MANGSDCQRSGGEVPELANSLCEPRLFQKQPADRLMSMIPPP